MQAWKFHSKEEYEQLVQQTPPNPLLIRFNSSGEFAGRISAVPNSLSPAPGGVVGCDIFFGGRASVGGSPKPVEAPSSASSSCAFKVSFRA